VSPVVKTILTLHTDTDGRMDGNPVHCHLQHFVARFERSIAMNSSFFCLDNHIVAMRTTFHSESRPIGHSIITAL
jgi:hypothetical protein